MTTPQGLQIDFANEFDNACLCAREITTWALATVDGRVGSSGLRNHLAGGAFGLALDRHSGMTLLAESNAYSPLLALCRPVVESYALGFWLLYIASDDDVERYRQGHLTRSLKTLLAQLIKHPKARISDHQSAMKMINTLDSLTHGDIQHLLIIRMKDPGEKMATKVRYGSAMLHISSWISTMAVEDILRISKCDEKIVLELREEGYELLYRHLPQSAKGIVK